MLRIGFLPGDFNPMVLMLGEAEDLRSLAGVLRRFARTGEPVPLHELAFCTAPRTRITLAADAAGPGVQADAAGHLLWRLHREQATGFAEQVEALALPSCRAGSALLQAGRADGIPVKVSRGEYTDDFLLDPHGAKPH